MTATNSAPPSLPAATACCAGVSAERIILDSNTGGERSKGGHSRGRKAVGVLAIAGTTAAPLRLAILVRRLHCVHEALSLYVRLLPSMLCGNLPAPVCHKVLSTCLIAYDKRKPALLCLWLTTLRTNVPAPALPGLQASTVVSSAGTIHSPALLLRSGISCGGAVGTNLRLHPCTCVVGVFPPGHRQQPQQQQGQKQAPQQPAPGRAVGDLEDLAGAPGSRTGGQEAQPQQEQQQQEQRQRRQPAAARCSN